MDVTTCVCVRVSISLNRNPEFFYPNVFVKIKETVPETLTTTNVSSVVFHGTHLEDVLDICQGTNAIFKGYTKQWRLLDNEFYNEEYCSYLVKLGQQPVPMKPYNSTPFGPFAWFGTKEDETDKYGPCQFEFNFTSVLRAYQTCRNSEQNRICYRAAGTLVYKQEICHIIMICCVEDAECQTYPLITAKNTCYFKPPNSLSKTGSQPIDLLFQTKINVYQKRHEHVTFALYLPNNRQLYLSYRDGKIKLTPHNTYCIASRSRECICKDDKLPISIDKLKILTRWISNEGQKEDDDDDEPVVEYKALDQSLEVSFDWFSSADEGQEDDDDDEPFVKYKALDQSLEDSFDWFSSADEGQDDDDDDDDDEPVVEYKALDQTLEDSFDWFSSADETEYYGDEGDRYDWHDFEDYDQLDFDDDEQNNSVSDSSVTIYYDSSTSSSNASEVYN